MWFELIWTIPFISLLLSIALLPLINKHLWEKAYPWICLVLGSIIAARYGFYLKATTLLIHTLHEYFSFICLIGSLYVVAGGIHISVKGESTPPANCIFLFIASIFSNLIGTTGASMVFIRPWIRMNKYRLTAFHIVFFIMIVSNVSGSLTPIGDPPLFLGYLKGVPFFWVLEHLFGVWLLVMTWLLVIFYGFDYYNYQKAPKEIRAKETGSGESWKFRGGHNILFLVMIIASVFVQRPIFVREALMLIAAFLSYKTTSRQIHESNDFNFEPIREVAILFLGIFTTMIPALQWLEAHADQIGITTPFQFYLSCGILSSVLDNAPTYLSFLSAEIGLLTHGGGTHTDSLMAVKAILEQHPNYIRAISSSAVFFGAMTYIGNGPNFLVKSIADHAKVKTPSFLGYIFKYSLWILLPVFILVDFVFFRTGGL